MKPKKNIKKHHLTEPKWTVTWDNEGLISRINEISNQIHRNTRRGGASWVVIGSDVARQFDEVMRDYQNIQVGDWRIEYNTYIQDITITPNRSVEYLDLNFTFTGDTWTEI